MYQILTGAQLYSIRTLTQTAEDMDKAFQALADMGYTSVQLSGQGGGIAPEVIRDLLDKHGLICPATHISFEEMENDLPAVIARHKLWGCQYPGIGGLPNAYRFSAEGYREFARKANIIGEKLEDVGMHFIYHNHAFEFARYGETTGIGILFEEFRHVQMELDVYWVQTGGGNPIEWIKKVAGRMDVVHFKEMVGHNPDEKNHTMAEMAPIGEGNFDWKAIQQACDETGVKYAFIEQDNAVDTDPLGCMKTSITNLTRLGGRFR